MQDQPGADFQNILERISRAFPQVKVEVVSSAEAPALAWTDANTLYVQKSVAEGLTRGDVHARYIIAHEIGHLALHHLPAQARATEANRLQQPAWHKQEREAALFTSAFLTPFTLVEQPQIAKRSGPPQSGAILSPDRFAELGLSDEVPLAPAIRARTDVISELHGLGYSEVEIAALVVPKRTLARRRAHDELLSVEETDKALRLARIAKQANRVFGDSAKAHRWLRKPKHALNGETPVAFLASEEGARKVEEMLVRIDHGMAA